MSRKSELQSLVICAWLDTTTFKEPIVAFVFGVKGLMADISFKGAKFTRIYLQK